MTLCNFNSDPFRISDGTSEIGTSQAFLLGRAAELPRARLLPVGERVQDPASPFGVCDHGRVANETAQRCTVRPAGEDDLLGVLRVMSRAEEGLSLVVEAPSSLERSTWATVLATMNLTTYVAEVGEELVGTASFLIMPNLGYECRPSGFVEAVVVASSHRRKGVAGAILSRVLADAKSAGCHKIQLLAHKRHASDGAHDFYRSMGFQSEAEGFRLYLDP